jgi:hypothetical protein
MVRLVICALAFMMFGAAAAGLAQDARTDTKSRTTVSVERGKDVTVTGCVAQAADGSLTLTHTAGKEGTLGSYVLVAEGADRERLEEHVGDRIEVRGRAVDQGDGRLTIRNKTEVRTEAGDRRTRESRTEVKGDLEGLPFLGVRSVRMLASVCP